MVEVDFGDGDQIGGSVNLRQSYKDRAPQFRDDIADSNHDGAAFFVFNSVRADIPAFGSVAGETRDRNDA